MKLRNITFNTTISDNWATHWFPSNTQGQEQTFSAVVTPTSDQMRFVFERFNHNYPNDPVEAIVSDIKLYRQEQSVGDYHGLDFGARIYDPKVGRFFSLDPRMPEFPNHSPYSFATNSPILLFDNEGEGPGYYVLRMLAESEKTTVVVSTSLTTSAAAIASTATGMAVDKYGNVALINIRGGLASQESQSRGPSFMLGYNFSVSADIAFLGYERVYEMAGNGGLFSAGVSDPESQFGINGDFLIGGFDEPKGWGMSVSYGPSLGYSYQNTYTTGVFMSGDAYLKLESETKEAKKVADNNARKWSMEGEAADWQAADPTMTYGAVAGQKGVYEAVITTTYHSKPKGLYGAKVTSTSQSHKTGVYFKEDSKVNLVSTDLKGSENE